MQKKNVMENCFDKQIYFDKLSSSNDYLIDLYKNHDFKDVITIYVDRQVSGRGRMGRSWYSGNGDGLTFSFSIKLNPTVNIFYIHLFVVSAITQLLHDFKISASVKYPNDIIVDNQKIGGVLTEIISVKNEKYIIVGIGLNVNNPTFPTHIPHAVSMWQLQSISFDKKHIFFLLIEKIKHLTSIYYENKQKIKTIYMSLLCGVENYVPCLYQGTRKEVKILSVINQNILSVRIKDDGVVTVNSQEIRFVLN